MKLSKFPLLLSVSVMLVASIASAETTVRRWAVLIGVSEYDDERNVPNLPFVKQDVTSLKETLENYGDYEERRVATVSGKQATRDAIERSIQSQLAGVRSTDDLIVYFSGHGIRAKNGQLYLIPKDCQINDLASTAIAADWLRQELAKATARSKILILDACHAGQGGAFTPASELEGSFEDLESVVVLASSSRNELSNPWQDRSLFSYWLTQALKGNGDANSDGNVDFHEVYRFVHERVTWTAHMHLGRNQTPVCYYGPSVENIPVLVTLRPKPIKAVISEMAEEVAFAIEREKLGPVATFTSFSNFSYNDLELEQYIAKDTAWLAKLMAEDFADAMTVKGGSSTILSQVRARELLEKYNDLKSKLVVTQGTFVHRGGPDVYLRAKAVEATTGRTIAEVGRSARISLGELPTLAKSIQVTEELRKEVRDPQSPGKVLTGDEAIVTNVLASKSPNSHPLVHNRWDYPLEVLVKNNRGRLDVRRLEFIGDRAYVALDKGERFQLRVHNKSGKAAFVKLLVDGILTRDPPLQPDFPRMASIAGQNLQTKGLSIQQLARHSRLNPDWYEVYVLPVGGFTFTGYWNKTNHYDFLVVDEHNALATRLGEVNSLGLISAAIYEELPGVRGDGDGLGVAPDTEKAGGYHQVKTGGLGQLIGWVHINYVSSRSLQDLKARQ